MFLTMNRYAEYELKEFVKIFWILIILSFLDVVSTVFFMSRGYKEAMPWAIHFINSFGVFGLIIEKAFILSLLFFFLFGVFIISRSFALFLVGTMAIGQAFIVLSNFVLVITGHICLFDIITNYIGGII